MSALIPRSLERSHQIETSAAAWRPSDSEEAEFASKVDQFVRQCIELGALVKQCWSSVREELYNGQIDSLEATGRLMQMVFEATHRAFERSSIFAAEAQRRRYTVENFADFAIERIDLGKLKQAFDKEWPKFDQQMIERSLADYNSGRFRSAEELLNEANGSGFVRN